MEFMLSKMEELIEEVYGYSIHEFPSNDFRDMGYFVDAVKHGYTKTNWLKFRTLRNRQGFSLGDDLLIEVLLNTEKAFNIVIRDEEAEKVTTISDLIKIVNEKTSSA